MGKAGLENLCNDVFPEALVLDVHDRVVQLRIEMIARRAEAFDAQLFHHGDELVHRHLDALFEGFIGGLLREGTLDLPIPQDLFRQGSLPLTLLCDLLQLGAQPDKDQLSTSISIICSQNID